jgi:hypothetical protein
MRRVCYSGKGVRVQCRAARAMGQWPWRACVLLLSLLFSCLRETGVHVCLSRASLETRRHELSSEFVGLHCAKSRRRPLVEKGNGERRKVCVIGGTEAREYQMKTLQLARSIHRCAYVCFSRTWPMLAREMYDDRQRWYDVGAKSLGLCNFHLQYRKYG